ncbi:hypothetical protein CMO93_02740 [Candidatus Woesearchaeota archaeon]|nr:hypothetical protein [Candidatus Woesearchaeota archaeon]|tara:strand:- start:1221 stop:1751 length:531 start_codon:yes stop_codon:yes gene_type:complete
MSELRLTVDHLRLNYTGPFDANALYRHITSFTKERGFDLWIHKEFEHDTKTGKHIEWQIKPWKQISDNLRYFVKVRILIYNYKKVDAIVNKKKTKIGNGKIVIYLDGYAELDQHNRWEYVPAFKFLSSIYHSFVYKAYTERFEQRLTYDVNHLYHTIEQFFNMYKHYKVVSAAPHI